MARATAFGSDPGNAGDQGQITKPPIPGLDPLERIARSLEEIQSKYIGSDDFNPQVFTVAVGANVRQDLSLQPLNGWIINVFQGTLNVWIGSYSGLDGGLPHFQYPPGQGPVYIPAARGGRIFTFTPTAAGAVAFSFTPCYL